MKRPTKQRVKRAIKADFPGKVKYIEAVELDSGVMVVEYESRSKTPTANGKIHATRRLVVINAQGRYRTGDILDSWWEEP